MKKKETNDARRWRYARAGAPGGPEYQMKKERDGRGLDIEPQDICKYGRAAQDSRGRRAPSFGPEVGFFCGCSREGARTTSAGPGTDKAVFFFWMFKLRVVRMAFFWGWWWWWTRSGGGSRVRAEAESDRHK